MLIWIAALAAVLFAVAGILTFVAFGQDDGDAAADGGTPGALADAGCSVETYAAQSRQHVAELEEDFEYNSEPPSTGPHSGEAPIFGIYTDPVDPLYYIHGLEHGGVVIQYGTGVPDSEVDAIAEWYTDDPNGLIVSPRSELPRRTIALVAWNSESLEDLGRGIVATCPRFDEEAFDAFVETYGFKGPESDRGDGVGFRREDLTPGTPGG